MKHIKFILDNIKNTSSRNQKEEIIRQQKHNELFKNILYRIYNPFIVYGIGDKKLNKFLKTAKGESEFKNIIELLDYLEVHNTGDDETVKKVAIFINNADEELREFYKEIVTKNLRIGVTEKSINKALQYKLIPEFNVQLAKKFEDEVDKIKGKKFVLTEKLDGCRCLLFVENSNIKAFSRQGQPILGLVDIFREAKLLLDGVYDGELLIANADEYKDRDVLQETLKIVRKDTDKRNVIFHVFDYITHDDFKNGKSKLTYDKRREFIENNIDKNLKWIKIVPALYIGSDLNVISDMLAKLESQGKEGLMLNTLDGKYQCKRTDVLLKIKSMNTMDCKIIGFEEGTGKYEGMLGALLLDYKGYELRCGSGFTDEDRKEIWNNKEKYLGKIAEIQYFRESRNQDGGLSVSFPVFICIRHDKDEPSYF
ncbi:RNA ligase family protein [Anoxybacillus flavithermus]|uniref:DNA ligase ATP-dependent n=1 Tax=Anoxybacillus flavithermus TaxID=33934 RepID=A0A178TEM2_9BACL|nr:RNA ligase family protein [Anoxybacillus flavithermus]OAO78591.1 DNA ligase ATP-dependent [Anoxybacillus flavithermus]